MSIKVDFNQGIFRTYPLVLRSANIIIVTPAHIELYSYKLDTGEILVFRKIGKKKKPLFEINPNHSGHYVYIVENTKDLNNITNITSFDVFDIFKYQKNPNKFSQFELRFKTGQFIEEAFEAIDSNQPFAITTLEYPITMIALAIMRYSKKLSASRAIEILRGRHLVDETGINLLKNSGYEKDEVIDALKKQGYMVEILSNGEIYIMPPIDSFKINW